MDAISIGNYTELHGAQLIDGMIVVKDLAPFLIL